MNQGVGPAAQCYNRPIDELIPPASRADFRATPAGNIPFVVLRIAMKRFHCGYLVLLMALCATIPAIAESAKSFYGKGQKAEARQQYEEAYQYFKKAYDLHPENTDFRSSFERTKFLA